MNIDSISAVQQAAGADQARLREVFAKFKPAPKTEDVKARENTKTQDSARSEMAAQEEEMLKKTSEDVKDKQDSLAHEQVGQNIKATLDKLNSRGLKISIPPDSILQIEIINPKTGETIQDLPPVKFNLDKLVSAQEKSSIEKLV